MTRFNTVALAAVLAVASACSNTAKGVEKDADNAGEKISETSERAANATANAADSAGADMSAAMETADVKTALLADTRIKATGINVDTDRAKKTVTLNGTVPADSDRVLAEQVATSKAPGYTVVNNLTIKK